MDLLLTIKTIVENDLFAILLPINTNFRIAEIAGKRRKLLDLSQGHWEPHQTSLDFTMKVLKSGPGKSLDKPKGRSDDGKERQLMYKRSEWRKLRARHLKAMPYCETCLAEYGIENRSWIVDHIRGHNHPNWRAEFFNPANLQTLCQKHHNIKTKKERPLSGVVQIAKERLTEAQRKQLIMRFKDRNVEQTQ